MRKPYSLQPPPEGAPGRIPRVLCGPPSPLHPCPSPSGPRPHTVRATHRGGSQALSAHLVQSGVPGGTFTAVMCVYNINVSCILVNYKVSPCVTSS